MVNDPSQWLLALHLWKLYAHLISLFIELSILVLFWDIYTFYPVRLQLPKTFFHVSVFIWLFAIRKFLLVPRFICQFLVFLPSYWCSSQKVLLPMPISWSVLLQQIESFRSYTKVFDLLRIYFRQDKKKTPCSHFIFLDLSSLQYSLLKRLSFFNMCVWHPCQKSQGSVCGFNAVLSAGPRLCVYLSRQHQAASLPWSCTRTNQTWWYHQHCSFYFGLIWLFWVFSVPKWIL